MRQRNYLLALVLLALFAASGVGYFRLFVETKKPFGIILFVGEGLVTGKLTAARLYDGGADGRLAIDGLPHVALLRTGAADFAVPDAASAASALACGVKVNHRALSTDPGGRALPALLQLAHEQGRATGLVTTGCLTDPTPAAFYAHAVDCRDRESLAAQLFSRQQGVPEVILGGGGGDFLPASKGGRRRDERDLVQGASIGAGKYKVLRTSADIQAVQPWVGMPLLGLFSADAMAFRDQLQTEGASRPNLAEMVAAAVETLQRRQSGYLLVVDAGLVERASLENQGERALQELIELDRAVGVAMQYAGKQTLVVVAGGAATGGLALNGYPLRQDHGVSLLGAINAYGFPSLTWATGPTGPAAGGAVPTAPAAFYSPYAANVADDAVAAGSGPGSERLEGFKDNTFIFDLIHSQL